MELSGTGIWSSHLRYGDAGQAAEAAAELEELGYPALWIPDVGGPVLESVENLLAATKTVTIATGILNLWMHDPAEVAATHTRLQAAHGGRFLLGIGVSHAPLIDSKSPGTYRKPLAATAAFLDGLDNAAQPVPAADRVIAALGPKMLQLAAERSRGTHPYLVTPEHTAAARAALGAGPLVLPEQTVVLNTDAEQARDIARTFLKGYLSLPNYVNNLLRTGFTEDDVQTISDRLVDAVVVWGDEQTIARRVAEHRDAGADHVCVQVLDADLAVFPREQWRRLAPVLN
ncbi:LLM class F420-dependent oxidoreductase [Mycolicibacterium bacteremicum]|uniref:LLM class F420-dependent oxidoreductase n=1 Tax=Mycolicibacterium bacteremicum TaxID=564198 RepID=A0A1W9YP27_MYCBA|nr:LLM class F420-dependent oxidoreductase [Mycolicibacterium bacteremicum]MCV7433347.1 LLM class F420-dependent oxidoreductase [Mycolicibacterium bacteremicum]ORA01550.1 LLM class F420-dependent oxidoreductase [Mycolicibacterium bacteremicum]